MAVVLVALPLLFDNVTPVRDHVRPVLGGRVRAGDRAGDHLSLVHPRHRRRRHDLAVPDHAGRHRRVRGRAARRRSRLARLVAILAGAVFAVPFGLLVAMPSLRIGDLYLALLTIGFALLVEQFVWTRNEYENFGAGVQIARPFGIGITDRLEMYAIVAVVFSIAAFAIVNLKRATSGLVSRIRSSEPAATTSGMSIVRGELVLFGVSAFVAPPRRWALRHRRGTALPKSFNALVRHRVAGHRRDVGRALGRRPRCSRA